MKKILLAAIVLSITVTFAHAGGKKDRPAPAADYFQRGIAAMNARNFDQAIADFDQAVSQNQNTTLAQLGRAYSFAFKEEWPDATDSLTAAIMSMPGVINALEKHIMYDFGGDYEKATADFEAALGIELTDDFKDEIADTSHWAMQRVNTYLAMSAE